MMTTAKMRALVLGTSVIITGCAMPTQGPPPAERDPVVATTTPQAEVVASCHVIELDAMSEEVVEVRDRVEAGIKFEYGPSAKTLDALVGQVPQYVFVLAHGWMNDVLSSREFSSHLISGIRERAGKDGFDTTKLAFVAVHWDSKRPIFHESALNAEVIGKRRVAPFLTQLHTRCPQAKIVLVGHSLGGRLCLAALNAGSPGAVQAAVLLEAAADQDALCPERASDMFGGFSLAPHGCALIANCCSQQDDVLRLSYANAMRAPALGREGADRGLGEHYPKVALTSAGLDLGVFEEALKLTNSKADGTECRVINVDATAVVTGHTEVFVAPIFDVIWRIASRSTSG
jgi:pimeloyl-ACP methyl ester carboxylesterase